MAKASKTKAPAPRKPTDPEKVRRRRRIALHSCVLTLLLVAAGFGYVYLNKYVDKTLVYPSDPPTIVLKDQPVWMSDSLAREITDRLRPRAAYSPFDQQALVNVVEVLKADRLVQPWVKHLNQVRRVYGQRPGDTIEVDCDWRAPIALVEWGQYYWYVNAEGYKLPDQFTAEQLPTVLKRPDGKLNARIITGVKRPPTESGQKWQGDDLAAGIDLVNYLADQPFAEEIVKVNVSNFAGRIDPKQAQIVLETSYNTQILWGRPVNAKDFFIEIPPAQKLDHLARIYQQYHRVDANHSQVDIRFEDVLYPAVEAPQQDANSAGN